MKIILHFTFYQNIYKIIHICTEQIQKLKQPKFIIKSSLERTNFDIPFSQWWTNSCQSYHAIAWETICFLWLICIQYRDAFVSAEGIIKANFNLLKSKLLTISRKIFVSEDIKISNTVNIYFINILLKNTDTIFKNYFSKNITKKNIFQM